MITTSFPAITRSQPQVSRTREQPGARFAGNVQSVGIRDRAITGASALLQDTLTESLSEAYLVRLLENAEVKNLLKTIFTPEYVKELLDSSQVQQLTKAEMEAVLTRDYLKQLLETSEAKKLLKETLTPDYIRELAENARLKDFAQNQLKDMMADPRFQQTIQQATRQNIKSTLSLLIQDALPPLLQMSAGFAALTQSQRMKDENVQTGLMVGGGYNFTQGVHKLLGLKNAPNSQMALGASSLLAAQALLPEPYQNAARLFGSLSLASGAFGRLRASGDNGPASGISGYLPSAENLKMLPLIGRWVSRKKPADENFLLGEVNQKTPKGNIPENSPDTLGRNPKNTPQISLHDAVKQGHLYAVEQWIEHSDNHTRSHLNQPNTKGRTPLTEAISGQHPAIFHKLISLPDTEVNHADQDGRTALHHAVLSQQVSLVDTLIRHEKIDPNHRDKDGQTPLHHAAIGGDAAMVGTLLTQEKTDPFARDKDGWTPFLHAARHFHVDAARKLVDREPRVQQAKALIEQDEKKVEQAFRAAAQQGKLDDLYTYLFAGINPHATLLDGRTALYQAAEQGHASVVEVLSHTGSDINQPSLFGWTPLLRATVRGHAKVVRTLIDAGADIRKTSPDGLSPLKAAEHYGHSEIVKLLKNAHSREVLDN